MENIPQVERVLFGQRAARFAHCFIQELVCYDGPDSIRQQRLAVRLLEQTLPQIPPSAETSE